jgi:hypothetical protein
MRPLSRHTRARPPRFRPALLALEARLAPAVLTVTNLSDHDDGSLRAEIALAQDGDTINFADDLGGGTIRLTSGQLPLDKSLAVQGPGNLTISGNDASRIFDVSPGVSATLAGLVLGGGRVQFGGSGVGSDETNSGGALYNAGDLTLSDCTINNCHVFSPGMGYAYGGGICNAGTLLLTDCTVDGNATQTSFGGCYGGGIYNAGTLALTDCTVDGNAALGLAPRCYGGGIYSAGTLTLSGCTVSGNRLSAPEVAAAGECLGGGLYAGGTAALTNCTVAGNSATSSSFSQHDPASSAGGGICGADGTLALTNCTVAGNTTAVIAFGTRTGGGVYSRGSSAGLSGSILAGNAAADGPDAAGSFTSPGHNLIGQVDGSSGWADTDLTGTAAAPLDPLLGPLQSNGGPTRTLALSPGSPAIDAGDPALAPAVDQRGVARAGNTSIGAFEYVGPAASFLLGAPASVTAGAPFDVAVTATDVYGHRASDYTGTVYLDSTDPQNPYLDAHTFTAPDGGSFTFTGERLFTAGPQTLVACDGTIAGSFDLLVTSGGGQDPAGAGGPADSPLAGAAVLGGAYANRATNFTRTPPVAGAVPDTDLPSGYSCTAAVPGLTPARSPYARRDLPPPEEPNGQHRSEALPGDGMPPARPGAARDGDFVIS